MTAVRESSYFKSWYDKNKERVNAARRVKYATSPEDRERALEYQREYRVRVPRASTKGSPQFREINGAKVQVFRIAVAASMAGCSVEFIRKYELAGVIPPPIFPSVQRYYTDSQIDKIGSFYVHLKTIKHLKDPERRQKVLDTYKSLFSTGWSEVPTSGEQR